MCWLNLQIPIYQIGTGKCIIDIGELCTSRRRSDNYGFQQNTTDAFNGVHLAYVQEPIFVAVRSNPGKAKEAEHFSAAATHEQCLEAASCFGVLDPGCEEGLYEIGQHARYCTSHVNAIEERHSDYTVAYFGQKLLRLDWCAQIEE